MKKVLRLKNLSCQNCVRHVTDHLSAIDGVTNVTVRLENQVAEVTTTILLDIKEYERALDDTIYEVEEIF